MKAVYIETFAPQNNIIIGERPKPTPGDDEVCIAVEYAGVNPADGKIAEGLFQKRVPAQFPLILGWEASGTIHSLGKNVTTFKVGDKVYTYCRKKILHEGTWAEFVTSPVAYVSLKPKNVSMEVAGAIPLVGLTAWQALFDKAHLKAGEKVLIHGGGGGVGSFAIQWAKHCGAYVITTGSAAKQDYIKQLGADEIIDYNKVNFVDEIKKKYPTGIDVVFDTLGGTVYKQSFEVLKPGGRIVSLREQPDAELSAKYKVQAEYLFVTSNGEQLKEITKLFESGFAKPPKTQVFSIDQVIQAVDAIRTGHTLGKIVLKVKN